MPLLKWTEERLMAMLEGALPADGARIDYDVLPNLFMMAYDGFVINRRLNDLRDIERLSDAMCDILLGPAGDAERFGTGHAAHWHQTCHAVAGDPTLSRTGTGREAMTTDSTNDFFRPPRA